MPPDKTKPKEVCTKRDSQIPKEIAVAVVGMLSPYIQGVSVDGLLEVIRPAPAREKKELLLTRREVAQRLKVSLPTVDRLIKSGELNSIKIRHSVRVPESAIEELMAAGARGRGDE